MAPLPLCCEFTLTALVAKKNKYHMHRSALAGVLTMNPYRPSLPTNDVSAPVTDVELRNPIVSILFSFIPVFIAVRSSIFLTWIYTQNKFGNFVMDYVLSGVAAWVIAAVVSSVVGMLFCLLYTSDAADE